MTPCPVCLCPIDRDAGHVPRCLYEVLTEELPRQNRGRPTIATQHVDFERDPRRLAFSPPRPLTEAAIASTTDTRWAHTPHNRSTP